jgi:hypothetical protein
MQRYKIITLVDITRNFVSRTDTDRVKISQQANFNSFIQAIGLRANIEWVQDPVKNTGRLPDFIDGKANHWIWEIDIERDDVFLKGNDPVGHLIDDLHGVPIVADLENNVDISPAAIQTKGENINTWVQII